MLQENMITGCGIGVTKFFRSEHTFRSNLLRHSLKVVEYLMTSSQTIVVIFTAVINTDLK
jgi:hypothetical protein